MSEMQEKDPERPQGAPPPAAEDPEQPAPVRPEDPTEGDTAPLRITHPPAAPNPFGGVGRTAAPAQNGVGNKTTQPAARTAALPAAPSGAPPAERTPPPGGLPRPVSQTDPGATRVSPAAYQPPPQPPLRRPPVQKPAYPPAYPPVRRPPVQKPPAPQRVAVPPRRGGCSWSLGCLGRTFFFGFFALALAALCVLSLMFYQYYRIAATLPDIEDPTARCFTRF